jgi:hypothetical protein
VRGLAALAGDSDDPTKDDEARGDKAVTHDGQSPDDQATDDPASGGWPAKGRPPGDDATGDLGAASERADADDATTGQKIGSCASKRSEREARKAEPVAITAGPDSDPGSGAGATSD